MQRAGAGHIGVLIGGAAQQRQLVGVGAATQGRELLGVALAEELDASFGSAEVTILAKDQTAQKVLLRGEAVDVAGGAERVQEPKCRVVIPGTVLGPGLLQEDRTARFVARVNLV